MSSSAAESFNTLKEEMIQTNKNIDICFRKMIVLENKCRLQAQELNELWNQLTDDKKNQLSCKDINEQRDKLLQMKLDHSKSCMEAAVKQGNLVEVRCIKEGTRLDLYIDIASEKGYFDIVKYILLYHNNEETWYRCIQGASKGGHLEIVKYCADNNVGSSLILGAGMYAAKYGHLDILKFIVSRRHIQWEYYLECAKLGKYQDVMD